MGDYGLDISSSKGGRRNRIRRWPSRVDDSNNLTVTMTFMSRFGTRATIFIRMSVSSTKAIIFFLSARWYILQAS